MNTIHIHNIVSARLTPVRTLTTSPDDNGQGGQQFHLRDLILIDDENRKTTITIFSNSAAQIALEAAQ